jgi:hypothetical protein
VEVPGLLDLGDHAARAAQEAPFVRKLYISFTYHAFLTPRAKPKRAVRGQGDDEKDR